MDLPKNSSDLAHKLEKIGQLEEAHCVWGVSLAPKAGFTVISEESADLVLEAIETGVHQIQRFHRVENLL